MRQCFHLILNFFFFIKSIDNRKHNFLSLSHVNYCNHMFYEYWTYLNKQTFLQPFNEKWVIMYVLKNKIICLLRTKLYRHLRLFLSNAIMTVFKRDMAFLFLKTCNYYQWINSSQHWTESESHKSWRIHMNYLCQPP